MPSLPTGTVTFLFTDIESSTRLWEEDPAAMRVALARHDVLIQEGVLDHNGYVFKTVGDAFCAAFHTPNDATRAALAIQQALTTETWPSTTPIKVRIALHTGEAELRSDDYFGQPLNRIARLLGVGYGGQILVSLATQELARDSLPSDAAFCDLGMHRLRDLTRPEHVFGLTHPVLPSEFGPLRSLDNDQFSNNLPNLATSFIGREKETGDIRRLMSETRLLTLTGSGGCGKTRLGLQVGADIIDDYSNGVWQVELAPIVSESLLPQAVAKALGVVEQPGKTPQQAIVEHLGDKHLLLILDNCEHLIAACAKFVSDLLRSCANVKVMATSREPLTIAGEQTYRVPSLSSPDPKQTATPLSVSQYESVRLYIERAQSVKSEFAVTNENAPSLAQICHRLDGIPLAIELAAARARTLPLEEINSRLENRFRLLTGGDRTALPRQQTLRALVDWSYDLLNAQEKLLLARLSVFAGGWSVEAAQKVGAGPQIDEWDVLDLLTSLVDKSLAIADTQLGAGRYRMLETVRQYAREKLEQSDEFTQIRSLHRDFYLELSEVAFKKLRGADQAHWMSVYEMEHDNFRQAIAFCLKSEDGALKGLLFGSSMQQFWGTRGYLTEGRKQYEAMLGRPEAASFGRERVGALNGLGVLAWMQGDYGAAKAAFDESLVPLRETGEKVRIGVALHNLGMLAFDQSDYPAARALYEESLAIFREIASQYHITYVLNNLGNLAQYTGDYDAAIAFHEEALGIRRQLGDKVGITYSLANICVHCLESGEISHVGSRIEEGLILAREIGNDRLVSAFLAYKGSLANEHGDPHLALTYLDEALKLKESLDDRKSTGICLYSIGSVRADMGDLKGSRSAYTRSLNIQRSISNLQGVICTLGGVACLAFRQGNGVACTRFNAAASTLSRQIGYVRGPVASSRAESEIASIRKTLGDDEFDAIWNTAQGMSWEQASDDALAFLAAG